jgi:prolyl-tRNA synthetase
MLGVPVRIEIGPRDMESGKAVLVRRDTGEKTIVAKDEVAKVVPGLLEEIQQNLFDRAQAFQEENTHRIDDYNRFKQLYEGEGGFAISYWCGSEKCETKIKDDTKATIRVLGEDDDTGTCIACGSVSSSTAVFSKAY